MSGDFFDDGNYGDPEFDSDYENDAEADETEEAYDVMDEIEDGTSEPKSTESVERGFIDRVTDPMLMGLGLGIGEEIAEEQRLQDGEPSIRVDKSVEKIPLRPVKKKKSNHSNYPGFFDYVLNRKK